MTLTAYSMAVAAATLALSLTAKKPDAELRVLDFDSGQESSIERFQLTLVSDAGMWQQTWNAHKGLRSFGGASSVAGEPAPRVDFKQSYVIALFGGQLSNVAGFEPVEIIESRDGSQIRLRALQLPGSSVLTTPYALIQISQTTKPIDIFVSTPSGGWRNVGNLVPPKNRAKGSSSAP